ncbi:S-adenosyl-L-methionine-dependent methyltransferases superfamily protein [Actinidia rufa]|uniref:Methyltransferase n=1 Tax=Actinidia rufa TaxID=165716 RepID=A0A7J0F3D2_9ERIC|nr:S-adenosyl-L-methionine-dependent methyltransferases superfamily protein [Actinidia rufa]
MATPSPPHQPTAPNHLKKPLIRVLLTFILCSLSYILAFTTTASSSSPNPSLLLQDPNCFNPKKTLTNHQNPSQSLHFEPNHTLFLPPNPPEILQFFPYCPRNFTNYLPCQDPNKEAQFNLTRFFHRERHCPEKNETLRCLVPKPEGYRRPFQWPKSREFAWFSNVPYRRLTVLKKNQNWVRLEGDRLVFPGGGTSFPKGVEGYIEEINGVLPLKKGNIRTVLDVGCGVASFGAALLDYDILTMSIAPRDIHEAQVQFALERGLPAMLGILSVHRLPFPSRSFDMAHCSRCLVPWTGYDGLFLMEIDRVLRPGGYWVLSGPPIYWRVNYKGWQRIPQELEDEQKYLEDVARRLCWKKVKEKRQLAVWQKPTNHIHCAQKLKTWKAPKLCADDDPDAGWYKKMDACITPLPEVADIRDVSGGALEKWPKRLNAAPPRIRGGAIVGTTVKTFNEDNQLWKRRVLFYGTVLTSLFTGQYRNIMDMNAGIGGFAAALVNYPVWVMNVVPSDAKNNTLGVIYERGLIGTYMNWCEPFSTYPRTYDLIHADGLFSMYKDKCDIFDILFEMYRILRPHGAVVIRDHVDVIVKIKRITDPMGWNGKVSHSLRGPHHPEKILFIDNSP